MLSWIRERFGRVVVGAIIGFIAFVFIFYGIYNPRTTRGLHETAVAGTVNGEAISISEFNRAYNQRVEMFKQMGGGKLSEAQLKMFRIRESVFEELTRRKLLEQEARRLGVVAGDEEVKDRIRQYPVFQKDGHFDPILYKQVLESNRLAPGAFERMIRDDASVERLVDGLRSQVRVTDREIEDEYRISGEKREIKYVLISPIALRAKLVIAPSEVDAFLKDEKKLNLVQGEFERGKDLRFKGKKFEEVRRELAEENLKSEKSGELEEQAAKLADGILPLFGRTKAEDAKVEAKLKEYGITVKTTGMVSRAAESLPGLGVANELMEDAFGAAGAIDLNRTGKAKRYALASGTVVAAVVGSETADPAKLGEKKNELRSQLLARRSRTQFEGFMKALQEKAKIDPNPSVVSSDGDKG